MKASLYIRTAERNSLTYLKESYCTQPFKIANVTEDKTREPLKLMMMTASPGILDGDAYRLKIEVAANTSLHLETQSFQRLYTMKDGASQSLEVNIATGASFCYLPHPTVPHAGAMFSATNNLYLEDNSRLVWAEIFTCGRLGLDKDFSFSTFRNLTNVYKKEQLIIRENIVLQPATMNLNAIGQMEGYTHQATLLFLSEESGIKEIMHAITTLLSAETNVTYGITSAPINGFILRLLGYKAEVLFDLVKHIYKTFLSK